MNLFRIELASFRTELKERMDEQDKKVDSNFSVSRIDKDGVSKEIRSYQKSIFIIEKKIENIYTLIERINKRGEACHKPA
jgi:archaellum component FlaC